MMARFAVGRAMSQPRDDRQDDLFRSSLEAIINLRHPLVRLAAETNGIFWRSFQFGMSHRTGAATVANAAGGRLFILKHMHNVLIGRGILSESVFKQPNS